MSTKIDHKIWENPPHLFGRQPGNKKVSKEVVSRETERTDNYQIVYALTKCWIMEERVLKKRGARTITKIYQDE